MLIPRTWMFVPGHSEKMVRKSFGLPLDVAMLDLEDGVVPKLKEQARNTVGSILAENTESRTQKFVRINAYATDEAKLDLEAIVVPGLEGLVVPKSENPEEVQRLCSRLDELEQNRGITAGTIKLTLAIETASGILEAPKLARCSARVCGLMFGAEDFSRDIGLRTIRTGNARDFIYARSAIVMASVAASIWAIDSVWPDLSDTDGLRADALLGRDMGMSGKSMIHPSQIGVISETYSPTKSEVAFAECLVKAFEAAIEEGHGSINYEGQLVDRPIYERAKATIQKASNE